MQIVDTWWSGCLVVLYWKLHTLLCSCFPNTQRFWYSLNFCFSENRWYQLSSSFRSAQMHEGLHKSIPHIGMSKYQYLLSFSLNALGKRTGEKHGKEMQKLYCTQSFTCLELITSSPEPDHWFASWNLNIADLQQRFEVCTFNICIFKLSCCQAAPFPLNSGAVSRVKEVFHGILQPSYEQINRYATILTRDLNSFIYFTLPRQKYNFGCKLLTHKSQYGNQFGCKSNFSLRDGCKTSGKVFCYCVEDSCCISDMWWS